MSEGDAFFSGTGLVLHIEDKHGLSYCGKVWRRGKAVTKRIGIPVCQTCQRANPRIYERPAIIAVYQRKQLHRIRNRKWFRTAKELFQQAA